jgi:two-component sensor histidine kinase/PAS domain-containing protein
MRDRADLDLDAWRDRVLTRMLGAVVGLAGLAAVGGIALSLQVGLVGVAIFDGLAWLALLGIWWAEGRAAVRANALVGLLFLVGVVVLWVIGPNGAGHLWLMGAPLAAALLRGRTAFLGWLAVCEATLLAFGGWARIASPWPGVPVDGLWWLLILSSYPAICLLVGLPTLELLAGLESSLEVRARSRAVAEQRERDASALRAQFELLFSESPAALLLVDPAGAVVRHNVDAQRLFDLTDGAMPALDALLGPEASRMLGVGGGEPAPSAKLTGEIVRGSSVAGRPVEVVVRVLPLTVDGRPHALVSAVDMGARLAAERALQAALVEKVTLLQEVHHRVKNNLQIVSSLLGLQADRVGSEDARVALLESTHRVRTMALIHQQLYIGETFSQIDFAAYTRALVGELCGALDPRAQVTFTLTPVTLVLAHALPCGLILNELVTNALKHGRSTDGVCRLGVTVDAVEGPLVLEVADGGAGFETSWSGRSRHGLGGSIIDALVHQLRATWEVGPSATGGARFRLVVPRGDGEAASGVG